MAQYLTWLMLITIAIGKYLMNGYSVVKEQPIHRYVNGKQVKDYPSPFTCFLT